LKITIVTKRLNIKYEEHVKKKKVKANAKEEEH